MNDLSGSPLARPLSHDAESDTYRAQYDWSSPVPLTTAVVEVIAEIEGVDPRAIGRLTTAVEPEALDTIFAPAPESPNRRDGTVSFVFDRYEVTVSGSGDIDVRTVDQD